MDFRYKINNTYYPVKRILFNDLKDIQLLILLNDDQQLMVWFDSLIYNANIDIVDKMCIFLYNYLLTISEKTSFILVDKDININTNNTLKNKLFGDDSNYLYIENIINNLKKIEKKTKTIELGNNSYIKLGLPNKFFSFKKETLDHDINKYIINDFIKQIVIDDTEAPICEEIINELPSSIMKHINDFVDDYCGLMKDVKLYGEEYENIDCHPITLFEYLKKIFTFDYNYLIKSEYILFRYIRATNYETLTFKEIEMLINAYNEDLREQEKQLNADKNQNPNFNPIGM